jgi:hypothetical protein
MPFGEKYAALAKEESVYKQSTEIDLRKTYDTQTVSSLKLFPKFQSLRVYRDQKHDNYESFCIFKDLDSKPGLARSSLSATRPEENGIEYCYFMLKENSAKPIIRKNFSKKCVFTSEHWTNHLSDYDLKDTEDKYIDKDFPDKDISIFGGFQFELVNKYQES